MARSQTLHEYNISRLNRWFVALAVLVVVCTVGMILDDYNRDWKGFQREARRLERERLQLQRAEAEQAVGTEQLQAAREQVEQAQQAVATQQTDLGRLKRELTAANGDLYVHDQSFRFRKAEYDVMRYEYQVAEEHHDQAAAAKVLARLESTETELQRLRLLVEQTTVQRDSLEAGIAAANSQVAAAQAQLVELTKSVETIGKRMANLSEGFPNNVLNAAMLDFIAPSIKIQQTLPPNLSYTVNFGVTARVDRCATCHVNIDRPGFDELPQPYRTHPRLELFAGASSKHPMSEFGCTECHAGRPNGLEFSRAAHTPSDPEEAERWKQQYGWESMHYWEWPMLASYNYESGCVKCHGDSRHIPGADSYNKGRDLVEYSGCSGCHKIAGYEGLSKIGPSLQQVGRKLTPEFAYRWINDPKQVRPHSRMPRVFNLENVVGEYADDPEYWRKRTDAEVNGIVAYLWDKSSTGAYALPDGRAGDAGRGKVLFESVGCRGCHMIGPEKDFEQEWWVSPRQHGPNLEAVGSKTSAAWIYHWIRDPKQYDPSTAMPNLRLTEQEALDITAFLTTLHAEGENAYPHVAAEPAMVEEALIEYLSNTQPLSVARAQLQDLNEQQRLVLLGEKIIARQGCFGCHVIEGFENTLPIGTELTEEGTKPVSRLAFNNVHIEHSLEAWLTHKMLHPRSFDEGMHMFPMEKSRMPQFDFTPRQAQAVVGNILAWTKHTVPLERMAPVDGRRELVAKGERLVAERNCRGCHVVEGEGGAIYDLIPETGYRPPNLANEGAKVQPDWLVNFLHAPTPIRPWVQVRMPTFDFSDEEMGTVANYFMALAKKNSEPYPLAALQAYPHARDGAALFAEYKCAQCHPSKVVPGATADASQLAPNLTLARERLRPDWIVEWLKDPQNQMPGTNMPTFFYADGEYFFDEAQQHIVALRDHLMTLPR